MTNPFEVEGKKLRKISRGKNLSFDEAFMDLQTEDSEVLDNEREPVDSRILTGIILLCLVVLFSRLFFLQGVKGTEYKALAEGNKLRVQYVLAPRGLLLDRYDKVIASNTPSFELGVITADLPSDPSEFDGRLTQIASIVGKDKAELSEIISKMLPSSFQVQTLVEGLTKDQALILISKKDDFKGFSVENNAIRDYKDPLVFTHLVGYTGKINVTELEEHKDQVYALSDNIGKTGIEVQYEKYLHGINGKKQTEVDAQGKFKGVLAEVPSTPGNDVRLNIDYDLQKKIYDALRAVMDKKGDKKAAAVATNPKTGEVLALVSLPSFDSNMFAKGITKNEYAQLLNDKDTALINRAITGQYPPGSTIKPIMATAALMEGIVAPDTIILDDGVIRVGTFTFYGYEREGLGLVDVYSAIARSSDIYFYTVGGGNPKSSVKEGLGPDRIAKYYRMFNLGKNLGIDLPQEKPGLVPDPEWKLRVIGEKWYLGNTYHISIGQGDVLSTPLQVNSWTATVANGGKIMQPYILKETIDRNGEILARGEPKVIAENIFDPNVIKIVQEGMRRTVIEGSGRSLFILPFEVSGKTGTAQFDAKDLTRTHSWFTSYAPSSNPEIVLTIIVEGAGEGHAVAVPISKEVYTWWGENRLNK